MAAINSWIKDKGNLNPSNSDDLDTVSHSLYSTTVNKLISVKKKLCNVSQKLGCSMAKNMSLGDQLSCSEHTLADTQNNLALVLESEANLKWKQNATLMQLSRGEMKYQHLADKLKTHWMKTKGVISETRKRIVMRIQGGLTPGICYTRSNFFIKGGEVTTSTITGDISPCDVKNILTKLNNQLPSFPHMPVHLMLASLHDVSSNLAHC